MARSARAFILSHTRLQPVIGLEDARLHLADDALRLWRAVQVETGNADAPIPFWAFAWGGGLAVARYLRDHGEAVAGRRVLDFGSGSGLCAIAATLAGASEVVATDIDPFAIAAINLNARANACRVSAVQRDLLADDPPDTDVILAADCWYEAPLAGRVLPWLQRARAAGIDVLVGDPGRRHLPLDQLTELASYEVRTTTELEDLDRKQAGVYALRDPAGSSSTYAVAPSTLPRRPDAPPRVIDSPLPSGRDRAGIGRLEVLEGLADVSGVSGPRRGPPRPSRGGGRRPWP